MVVKDGKVQRRADGKKKRRKVKHKNSALPANGSASATTNNNEDDEDNDGDNTNTDHANNINRTVEKPADFQVEYVPEELAAPSSMSDFAEIFSRFQVLAERATAADDDEAAKEREAAAAATAAEDAEEEEPANKVVSKKKSKKANRLTVAELKTIVDRPDVVELHDANATDPKLLVHLKVRLPWCPQKFGLTMSPKLLCRPREIQYQYQDIGATKENICKANVVLKSHHLIYPISSREQVKDLFVHLK